jgi:hypothetical protein
MIRTSARSRRRQKYSTAIDVAGAIISSMQEGDQPKPVPFTVALGISQLRTLPGWFPFYAVAARLSVTTS